MCTPRFAVAACGAPPPPSSLHTRYAAGEVTMEPLSAAQLLDVCERGRGLPPVRQALLLLEAACPAEPPERLAALPVGRRDARLLALRALLFGAPLEGEMCCPACGERLELDLPSEALRAEAPEDPSAAAEAFVLAHDGYEVVFRLPTSQDLVAVGEWGLDEAATRLLTRCLLDVRQDGEPLAADQLPAPMAVAVGEAMAAADPLADLQMALTCPACEHGWSAPFDVAAFLWAEVEAWAPRLLQDVHRLASAYGWRERDILAMSPWRRGQYLQILGA